jgi:hypothetical protein
MNTINDYIQKWAKFLDERIEHFDEENMCYINVPRCNNKEEEEFVQNTLIKHGAIPLHKLEVGKTYIGECRNASEAVWQGDKFEYMRTKFGSTYPEKINHFQNDDGYDVFVPVKLKEE